MKKEKSDKALEKEMRRDGAKIARSKSLMLVGIITWLLLAIVGTAIAVCLGLTRNDWILWSSDVSAGTQDGAASAAQVFGWIGAGVCGLLGLVFVLFRKQLVIGPLTVALGAAFPLLVYGPTWLPFALGGGAILVGLVVLKLVDRKASRAK
jgi:hypothetical protein